MPFSSWSCQSVGLTGELRYQTCNRCDSLPHCCLFARDGSGFAQFANSLFGGFVQSLFFSTPMGSSKAGALKNLEIGGQECSRHPESGLTRWGPSWAWSVLVSSMYPQQSDIATDRIVAYRKYFPTDRPVPLHSRLGAVRSPARRGGQDVASALMEDAVQPPIFLRMTL